MADKLTAKTGCQVGCILLLSIPLFAWEYALHIAILILIHSLLSLSWSMVGGSLGRLSLGHALFFGIGGYTCIFAFNELGLSPILGTIAGAGLGMVAAMLIGLITLRFKLIGPYFSIFTIAAAESARLIVRNSMYFGGAEGMSLRWQGGDSFWSFQFEQKAPYYYLCLILTLLLIPFMRTLRRSTYGRVLLAIRDDRDAAESIGIDTYRYSIAAFALSGFFTAFSGAVYALYFMYIHPDMVFGLPLSVALAVRSVVGGRRYVSGPVLGTLLLTPIAEWLRTFAGTVGNGGHAIAYGVVLVLSCVFLPDGVIGKWESYRGRLHHRS